MRARANNAVYCFVALALILASAWSMNIAIYNWWAAGFPHAEYGRAFAMRGNIFSVLAIVLFAALVSVILAIFRASKKRQLSEQEREVLLRKLSASEIPDREIGSTIVGRSKPLDRQRTAAAKETVLRYLNHQNSWARHEAMWFIRWGGFREENEALIISITSIGNGFQS
jgi:cbb3-type cytochrome oxidase subunit 3